MWTYEVIAQFAKANAPSLYTDGFEEYLLSAMEYFNMRSRVATNPKEITKLEIVDDKTIRIILNSHDRLNISQVSRSLRVFSVYLIDENHPMNFGDLISGKRLFRMSATEIASVEDQKQEEALSVRNNTAISLNAFKELDMDAKLNEIYKLLLERR